MTTRPHLGDQPRRAQASPELIASLQAARDRPTPTPTPEVAAMLIELASLDGETAQPSAPLPDQASAMQPCAPPARRLRSGYRKNSIWHRRDNGFEWRLLDRNARARLWVIAQSMERITKKKGARNGCLGAIGLTVLNCLLFGFLNAKSGRCDPSYEALMKKTGLCRQSITNAIDRLESSGLVTVTRRMMRFLENGIVVVRQISNAYVLADPAIVTIPDRPSDRTWRPFPPRKQRGGIGDILGRLFERRLASLPGSGKSKHPLAPRTEIVPT